MTLRVCSASGWTKLGLAGLILTFGAALEAQTVEISPFVSAMRMGKAALGSISYNNTTDTDTRLGNSRGYGVHLTWNPWKYYGHEVSYVRYDPVLKTAVHPATGSTDPEQLFSQKVQLHMASYNFMMYFMPKGERFRPYATGGLQAYQFQRPRIDNFPSGSNRHYGGNYGVGMKVKLIPHLLVRFDLRNDIGGKPYKLTFKTASKSGGFLQQIEGSFGIGFAF